MKRGLLLTILGISFLFVTAQNRYPVSWKVTTERIGESTYRVNMQATVDSPYHIYPQNSVGGMGMPTKFTFAESEGMELVGETEEKGEVPGEEAYYSKGVTFSQIVKLLSSNEAVLRVKIRFMACTNEMCLAPASKELEVKIGGSSTSEQEVERNEESSDTFKPALQYQPFSMVDLDGKTVSVDEIIRKSKYTYVDFWASWCAPCRVQLRALRSIYRQNKERGLAVIGVSLDTDSRNWRKAVTDDGYDWTNISDLQGFESPIIKKYGITAIPRNFLVDSNGKVVAVDLHGKALEAKLKELFAE